MLRPQSRRRHPAWASGFRGLRRWGSLGPGNRATDKPDRAACGNEPPRAGIKPRPPAVGHDPQPARWTSRPGPLVV